MNKDYLTKPPVIEISQLSQYFQQGQTRLEILKEVSLKITAGEMVGLGGWRAGGLGGGLMAAASPLRLAQGLYEGSLKGNQPLSGDLGIRARSIGSNPSGGVFLKKHPVTGPQAK